MEPNDPKAGAVDDATGVAAMDAVAGAGTAAVAAGAPNESVVVVAGAKGRP